MNNQEIANLTLQLQRSLDSNYDVVDMQTVLFVIQQLESTTITKEQLETTRLARYINQLRRRTTSDVLARRAKNLLKRWRDSFMPTLQQQQQQQQQSGITASGGGSTTTTSQSTLSRLASPLVPGGGGSCSGSAQQFSNAANNVPISLMMSKSMLGSLNSKGSVSNGGYHAYQQVANSPRLPISVKNSVAPTSFTNVLGSQSSSSPLRNADPPCVPSGTAIRRTETSPQAIGGNQSRRQSPISLLDFDSNQSRPAIINPNSVTTPNRKILLNGDITVSVVVPSSTIDADLHDSNSVMLDTDQPPPPSSQQSEPLLLKSFIKPPKSQTVVDPLLSNSGHRKSKKHKKDKKRGKLGTEKGLQPVELQKDGSVALETSSSLQYVEVPETLPAADKIPGVSTTVAGIATADDDSSLPTAAAVVFPPNDSLSSSSMSRFPSNLSTNTMTMQNSIRQMSNNYSATVDSQSAPSDADLTFAGKFKSVGSNQGLLLTTTVSDSLSKTKKPLTESKDSQDVVVVVESRSSSPFTTGHTAADDSCSSSSRTTIMDTVNNSTVDSTQVVGAANIKLQPASDNIPKSSLKTAAATAELPIIATGVIDQPAAEMAVMISAAPAPKKRGRKKGSRGIDAIIAQTHTFNMSMLERSRLLFGSKKVKTTKELLADIQNRRLGSSTTSSPTLPINRPSISPSTCSEASFQSDLTNTRASITQRSSPELHTAVTNCRQSDIDEINSATDSNEGLIQSKSNQSKIDVKQLVTEPSSIEEYLRNLLKLLPPVDRSKLSELDETAADEERPIVCSCTIREIEPVPEVVETPMLPKVRSIAINESISKLSAPQTVDSGLEIKNHIADEQQRPLLPMTQLQPVEESSVSPPIPVAPSFSSLKKPIKSIFDLDYDDDNDPLHSFVEAAKLKLEQEKLANEIQPIVGTNSDGLIKCNREASCAPAACRERGDSTGVQVAAAGTSLTVNNNLGKLNSLSNSTSPALQTATNNSVLANVSMLPPVIVPSFIETLDDVSNSMVAPPPPSFPTYEVVEDPNCPAKHRYEIQTNCITNYHVNALHNFYIPNVNGNWNAPVPITVDHRKKLRRYRRRKNTSALLLELSCTEEAALSSDDDKLYERVVPQYDHITADEIVKDLSDIQFTRNYEKKKLRRLKRKLGAESWSPTQGEIGCFGAVSDNIVGGSNQAASRKRLRSAIDEENLESRLSEPDDDTTTTTAPAACRIDFSCTRDDGAIVHKYEKRRKRRKLRECKSENEDQNMSEGRRKKNCDRRKGDDENIVDIDESSSKTDAVENSIVAYQALAQATPYECDTVLGETNCNVQPSSSPAIALVEDSSRESNFSDIASKKDAKKSRKKKKRRRLSTSDEMVTIEPAVTSPLPSNDFCDFYDFERDVGPVSTGQVDEVAGYDIDNNEACYGDEYDETEQHGDYGDEEVNELEDEDGDHDDDEEEDERNSGDEHEVVTHDMTSSTSTTSQQHIVLTIKKKQSSAAASAWSNKTRRSRRNRRQDSPNEHHQLSILNSSPTSIRIRRRNRIAEVIKDDDLMIEPKVVSDVKNDDNTTSGSAVAAAIFDNNNVKCNSQITDDPLLLRISRSKVTTLDAEPFNKIDRSVLDNISNAAKNDDDIETVKHRRKLSLSVDDQLASVGTDATAAANETQESFVVGNPTENINSGCADDGYHVDSDCKKNNIDVKEKENGANLAASHKDDDNESIDNEIPNDNNALLKSFNYVNDENCLGLRIVHRNRISDNIDNKLFGFKDIHNSSSGTGGGGGGDCGDVSATAAVEKQSAVADTDAATVRKINSTVDDQQSPLLIAEFKEWHQVLQVPSYNDELLTILPYVVID